MIFTSAIFLSLLVSASATCDNSCSGHGVCECGQCECYDNWGMGLARDTGDCSDRICPFELAWVDHPDQGGLRHKYAECAGRGICNRESAECECFDGYEGKGCQRTTCPNDCSGHGTCEYMEQLAYAAVEYDYRHMEYTQQLLEFNDYSYWDKKKTRGCLCDPEFADVDCSKRMCPYGNDMMDRRQDQSADLRFQTQRIRFTAPSPDFLDSMEGQTFALTFKSKLNETFTTIPIVFTPDDILVMATNMENALLNLPNGVIDGVHIHTGVDNFDATAATELVANVTFTGDSNQGTQYLLTVEDYLCADGCFPQLTGIKVDPMTGNVTEQSAADYNSFECGRRGKCDYDSGLCQCFEGFTGPSCGTCTSLI